jgi:hypothetical protein
MALAVAVLGCMALAGCGGGSSPSAPNGTAANSAVGGGTTDGSVPQLSALAKEQTDAGEEAFTRYFFQVVNHAFQTGQTAPLINATAPTCQICRATIGDISYAFARGRIRGGELTVQKVSPHKGKDGVYNRVVTYSETKYEEVDARGKVMQSLPAKKSYQLLVKLVWAGSGWQVAQLSRLPTGS